MLPLLFGLSFGFTLLMMGVIAAPRQVLRQPLTWFKINAQVRKTFSDAELRQLGESLRAKQLQAVLARSDGTLIAGERRYRAAKLVGLTHLDVVVTDEELTESQIKVMQLTENMQREDLAPYEKWQGCKELLEINPDWSLKQLAEHLHLDPSMVTRLLSPSKCIEAAQQALREGKIGITDAYAISKLPESDQLGLLSLKLSGASRETIEAAGRKTRSAPSAPAVRVSKIKCPLPSGVTVQVTGGDLTLLDLIELLSDLNKQAKKGHDEGMDAKAFMALLQARAKDKKA